MSRITERLREGIFVNLCGIVGADQTIDAIVCEIPEPTVEVEITRVRAPEGVPGGQWTRYIVEGVVRNTGKQRILSCNASVRVHVRAATSLLVPIPSKRLMPGAKYEFAVECRMVNPRTVSPPVGEVMVESPEW